MARLHLPQYRAGMNPYAGIVDCSLRPAGAKIPTSPPGVGWVDGRVAELRQQGIDATVLRLPGQSPVITYRTT